MAVDAAAMGIGSGTGVGALSSWARTPGATASRKAAASPQNVRMLHLLGRLVQGKIPCRIYRERRRPIRAGSRPMRTAASTLMQHKRGAKKTARACALAVVEHAAEAAVSRT